MPTFMPGLQLSELFYHEAVKPILDQHLPDLAYSAALIGWGSEVLGYDTAQSTDHHWGPRLLVFLFERDMEPYKQRIDDVLRVHLPPTFRGYSTNFGQPDGIGVRLMQPSTSGPVAHMVEVFSIDRFFSWYLGVDPRRGLSTEDWLTLPQQRLLVLTVGWVFHDGLGELEAIRTTLRYYPDDVWRYLLAAQWGCIGQEEAFVGRCGDVGDELGSRIVAMRLVQALMKLCFLMEQRYAPYSKWFGTAFKHLRCAPHLAPLVEAVLAASDWHAREKALAQAYQAVATLHNALGITALLDPHVAPYYDRPYLVINAPRFVEAITATIIDPKLRTLPLIGSVDQFVDSVDLLTRPPLYSKLRPLFREL